MITITTIIPKITTMAMAAVIMATVVTVETMQTMETMKITTTPEWTTEEITMEATAGITETVEPPIMENKYH